MYVSKYIYLACSLSLSLPLTLAMGGGRNVAEWCRRNRVSWRAQISMYPVSASMYPVKGLMVEG